MHVVAQRQVRDILGCHYIILRTCGGINRICFTAYAFAYVDSLLAKSLAYAKREFIKIRHYGRPAGLA